eukprot:16445772-Heterocapsa_arctica.AAC.1
MCTTCATSRASHASLRSYGFGRGVSPARSADLSVRTGAPDDTSWAVMTVSGAGRPTSSRGDRRSTSARSAHVARGSVRTAVAWCLQPGPASVRSGAPDDTGRAVMTVSGIDMVRPLVQGECRGWPLCQKGATYVK